MYIYIYQPQCICPTSSHGRFKNESRQSVGVRHSRASMLSPLMHCTGCTSTKTQHVVGHDFVVLYYIIHIMTFANYKIIYTSPNVQISQLFYFKRSGMQCSACCMNQRIMRHQLYQLCAYDIDKGRFKNES